MLFVIDVELEASKDVGPTQAALKQFLDEVQSSGPIHVHDAVDDDDVALTLKIVAPAFDPAKRSLYDWVNFYREHRLIWDELRARV